LHQKTWKTHVKSGRLPKRTRKLHIKRKIHVKNM